MNYRENNKIKDVYWVYQACVGGMKSIINIREDHICFIIGNFPVHGSSDMRNYLKETQWLCLFLPQYSRDFASVKLFFWQLP